MISLIVPSRGRPAAIAELAAAVGATSAEPDTTLMVCVDEDDQLAGYYESLDVKRSLLLTVGPAGGSGMTAPLNRAAVVESLVADVIGFCGDDHRPRTPGWDTKVLEVCEQGPAIVYGNDLVHGAGLPTFVFMSSSIVRALGFMVPPRQHHLFLDNFWKDLGERASCLHYLEDMVFEHLHPLVGKAEDDEGYRRVNAMWAHDEAEYKRFQAEEMDDAVAKVRAIQ